MIREIYDRLRMALETRRHAYSRTFAGERGSSPDIVIRDLAKFCRAHASTFSPDQRIHAVMEGRREVWLRIQQHMNMTPDELWQLYDGRDVSQPD